MSNSTSKRLGGTFDPKLDLLLERDVDVRPDSVWDAWTEPEQLMKWFTPAPWLTVGCEIDLRPGGIFRTVMRSPDGAEFDNDGCYLDVVPNARLVWTSALGPGFRPHGQNNELPFTAVISIEPSAIGTKYSALVMHPDQATSAKHAEMGFHEGWGAAFDQLIELVQRM